MKLNDFGINPSSEVGEDDQGSLKGIMSGLDYDEIYVEAWKSAIARCERGLNKNDLKEALEVKSAELFRLGLNEMLETYPDDSAEADVLLLLVPILEHYDQFANSFVELMRNKVEVSMMWGLLFLVVKLALGSPGALERVNRMVKSVGIKLEYMNETMCNLANTEQKKNVYVEVSKELVNLWLNIISAFRDSALTGLKEATWELITTQFGKVLSQLEEASERISRNLSLSLSKSHKDDFQRLQALLREEASSSSKPTASVLPHMLPSPKNTRFYGREGELGKIHELLAPSPTQKCLLSTAIHGLGGVGKSQIALMYAQQHAEVYDAIFWIHAQTLASLEQSFTKAVRLLGLGTEGHDTQNRIILLDWLQSTEKTWLLIFDNAENTEWILQYWPVSDHGSALITTRRHVFGIHPASSSIPINPFSIDNGADFVFHLLGSSSASTEERKDAIALSELVGGHALALAQASSLMFKKKWSISKYLEMHSRYPEKIRDAHSLELMHAGYTEGVKTVFVMSFQSLSSSASVLLGILSLLAPDGIPESIFSGDQKTGLPGHLQFCTDEFEVSDIIEELISLALVQRDANTDKLSIHRLVQSEFRFYTKDALQRASHDASKLLYESFPKQVYGRTFKPYFEQCSMLIQHLYFVRDHVGIEPINLQPSKEFCRLMCNGAYYLVEMGSTKELETMIKVTMEAFKSTELIHEDVLAYAHLCNSAALEREMSGYFNAAKTLLELARNIRCKELPAGHEEIWVVMNNLGNLSLSLQNYDDALRFHLMCQETVAPGVRGNLQMNLINLGRAFTGLGRFSDAMEAFNRAKEYSETAEPDFRGFYYWVANMYMAQGNLQEAETMYIKGRERLKEVGENISADMATCVYKLGLIALRRYYVSRQEHELKLAANQFKEAVTMMEFWKVADCEIARASYMLSIVLFLQSSDEAVQWRNRAESIRKVMQRDKYIMEAHGEWTYDLLVESWVR